MAARLYFFSSINNIVSLPKVENVVYAPQKPTPIKSQVRFESISFSCNFNNSPSKIEPVIFAIHVLYERLVCLTER